MSGWQRSCGYWEPSWLGRRLLLPRLSLPPDLIPASLRLASASTLRGSLGGLALARRFELALRSRHQHLTPSTPPSQNPAAGGEEPNPPFILYPTSSRGSHLLELTQFCGTSIPRACPSVCGGPCSPDARARDPPALRQEVRLAPAAAACASPSL